LQLSFPAEQVGQNEVGLEAKPPSFGTGLRGFQPVADAALQAHRQLAKINQLGYGGIDRHRPLLRFPVVFTFGLDRQGPGVRPGIGHKRLNKGVADIRPVAVAGNGPDMVGQRAHGPWPPHGQHDRGGPCTPLLAAEQRIRGRWQE
jgi:hypothetical protein